MAYDGEGTVYIPLEEFWEFVQRYVPVTKGAETAFGVPRVECGDLVIDYACSTDCHPTEWATPPKAVQQWKDLKASQQQPKPQDPPEQEDLPERDPPD